MMLKMTENRMAIISFRWSICAVLALWMAAASAPVKAAPSTAPAANLSAINGVYNGTYVGDQGPIKFKLSLIQKVNGTIDGTSTFYLPDGSATKEYTCGVSGGFTAANRTFQLLPVKWDIPPTDRVVMAGMSGVFDPDGGNHAGQISGRMRARPGPKFEAIRDADESAKMVAAANSPAAINGVYSGEFKPNETRKLTLSIKATEDGSLTAVFTFGPPARKEGPSITYKLTGKYDAKAKTYAVGPSPYQFTTIEPIGSGAKEALDASKAQALHVGIVGPGSIVGLLTGSHPEGGDFSIGQVSATKDGTQPADLDQAMLAQADAATAPPAPVVRRPFEGVYNGTYATDQAPTTKFKLMLWLEHESVTAAGKVVGTNIAGLLTVFPSDDSGTLPCVCELKGFYGDTSRFIQLTSRGWEPRMSNIPLMTGLEGKFDPGGSGVAQISGAMTEPGNPAFQATKDAAESTSMDIERLRNHVYPCIVGVFNGTYTRENQPPSKFKLTIKHNGDGPAGLAGMATIYLPSDSGTKPYTYDLKGVESPHGEFQLLVHDWVSTPPSDFKNFKAMGFNGKVIVNEAVTTAKMSSTPPAPSMAEFYLPQFDATWDTTESADINGAIAAQKALGSAEQVVALKAREQLMKDAAPKQLASKDLVRKSRQYWEGYQTDMVREVFDGGFGAAMDENEQFQRVFLTYVGTFSAKCPECLPANHQTVTVTEITSLTVTQNAVWHNEADRWQTNKTERTYTVEMDPRFVARFNQFHAALNSPGAGLRDVAAAAQSGGAQSVVRERLTIVTDMQRFFADHGGNSAAMRQMNENFLRAINGEASLQQADGKIDGAQAESDKDLLPGRYARFVDGANAYFRERAKANPIKFGNSSSHDTALCQRLAELYEFHMTREEEYYYANDFAGLFVPIMGIRASCPDPAWPQLHPDVEKAIAEVK
jgi:hypothetical protein